MPAHAREHERLAALLTYGDPYEGPGWHRLIVTPRLGTVSPWASKATDIARNCGLACAASSASTEYRISLKAAACWASPELSAEQLAQVAALLHDRMTESVVADRAAGCERCSPSCSPRPWSMWMCWAVAAPPWNRQYPLGPGAGRRRD
jgi:phosphoribosylformylglycinamidine synthase